MVEAFTIPTGSMQNTLLVGDFLFVNKFLYGAEVPFIHKRLPMVREPKRGDIIVFDSIDSDMKIVKRLIGVPGDTLEMRDGVLFRNGLRVREPYAVNGDPSESADPLARMKMRDWQSKHFLGVVPRNYSPDLHHWGPIVVPQDSLFVMGDNRDSSYDGRFWGFLPRSNVRGEALILVYFSYDAATWQRFAWLRQVRWGRLFSVPR